MPGGVLERGQMACGLGAQGRLLHQLLGIGAGGRDQVGVVGGVFGQRLVQLPQRAVQGELAIVGQNLFDLTDIGGRFTQMRGHQIGQRIAEGMGRDQRFSRQQFRELGLAGSGQITCQVRAF